MIAALMPASKSGKRGVDLGLIWSDLNTLKEIEGITSAHLKVRLWSLHARHADVA